MLTLGVRRTGESRNPEDMLKYDDGDAGGKEDGGVMAMGIDSLAPPLPPGENEVLAKASATGPELASAAPELPRFQPSRSPEARETAGEEEGSKVRAQLGIDRR